MPKFITGDSLASAISVSDGATPFTPDEIKVICVSPTGLETEYTFGVDPEIINPNAEVGYYEAYIPTTQEVGTWHLIWRITYKKETATVVKNVEKAYRVFLNPADAQ